MGFNVSKQESTGSSDRKLYSMCAVTHQTATTEYHWQLNFKT